MNLRLNAYAAYGFKDKRFKYSGGFNIKPSKLRRFVEAQYTRDEQFKSKCIFSRQYFILFKKKPKQMLKM